ncbi:BTAD domain-containing putative transcriptional regulator [Nonomuraea sp. NPDC050663]|uniref:AfsR/SARP family transcriptional regulator n=1 Tax=Nonomuraea sp. NPDC050663 TaxID=3364370 RepID=UPI0037A67D28
MELRLLGPVEVWCDERQLLLGGAKPRGLLAALLLDAGRVVTVERLVEAVWGADPPRSARGVLHTYVASLRRAFGGVGQEGVIVSHRVGYTAAVPPGALDKEVFESLVAHGRRAAREGGHHEAGRTFRAALALWRGPALGGLGDTCLRAEAARLQDLRLAVLEERIAADLASGGCEGLIDELTELVAAHPVRERLRGDLMVALYRAGRQAEALAVYQQGRLALIDELGIEPGPALQRTHEAILRSDPALLGVATTTVAPRQLPPSVPDFAAREVELDTLRARLTRPRTWPVCVIVGPGGVGKSALALRAAHEIAAFYPDGQLHVELRGTTETLATPREVLGRLLRELEPGMLPPDTLEECAARYRTLLAGRRTLVLLDDAASESQVRPLLPGTPGSGVIVTSRVRLTGLAGASALELGMLPDEAALRLLGRIAGPARIAADPEASARLVRQCCGLPLALRIAGSRLASRGHWSVAQFADRLADEQHRLDELTVGDQEVRAGIALSYELLRPDARAALRRLGMLGLPSISVWVAAAALETGLEEAERVLEHLVDASLATVAGQRYRLHDLIRLFARERAHQEEPPPEREAVVRRVLGGCLWLLQRLGEAASAGVPLHRGVRDLARPLEAAVLRAALADPDGWLRAEEENLIAAVELAAGLDLDDVAVELAATVCSVALEGSRHVFDDPFTAWHRTHQAALGVARRMGNGLGEATLLAGLGRLHFERDDFPRSRECLGRALPLFRSAGEVRGEAAALAALGAACREQGHLAEALEFLARADRLWSGPAAPSHANSPAAPSHGSSPTAPSHAKSPAAPSHGKGMSDPAALAHVKRLAGSVHLEKGDYPAAWSELAAALRLYQEAGSVRGEGLTLRTMALHHRARGELDQALELCERALAIFHGQGDRLMAAYTLGALAKTRIRLGALVPARLELREVLAVTRALNDRWGEAWTLRTQGELALAEGDPLPARSRLEESLARWETVSAAVARARTLRDLSRAHRELGDAAAAAAAMAEALEVFRVHGAREYRELLPFSG